jgi:hypothetical protein
MMLKCPSQSDLTTKGHSTAQHTIRCHLLPPPTRPATTVSLTADRLLAFEAIRLLIRLDKLLREARADWNQDRFRRLMKLRATAVVRLRRRWARPIPLGQEAKLSPLGYLSI